MDNPMITGNNDIQDDIEISDTALELEDVPANQSVETTLEVRGNALTEEPRDVITDYPSDEPAGELDNNKLPPADNTDIPSSQKPQDTLPSSPEPEDPNNPANAYGRPGGPETLKSPETELRPEPHTPEVPYSGGIERGFK